MTPMNVSLCLCLVFAGALFLVFAVIFAVKKEKACRLIGGFNCFTEAQQARYDRAAIARDYKKMFTVWAVGAFVGGVLCLWLGWWAFGAAMALFLFSIGKDMHIYADKAFEKYKIDQ